LNFESVKIKIKNNFCIQINKIMSVQNFLLQKISSFIIYI